MLDCCAEAVIVEALGGDVPSVGIPEGEHHAGIDMIVMATAVFNEGGEEVDVKLIDVILIEAEVSYGVMQDSVRMAG